MQHDQRKKGKAKSDVTFSVDDPPSSYSNATVHSRISEYTAAARQVHGPEWDPSTEDIDGEIVMRVGGGKKHGRYWIADSVIDTASTPTLSQIRARNTDSAPPIRPRPSASQMQYEQLQVQMRDEMEDRLQERLQEERERMRGKMDQMMTQRVDTLVEERMQAQMQRMMQYMSSLGTPPPPGLFTGLPPFAPPPVAGTSQGTPNQSFGSNQSPGNQWSPWPGRQ